MNTRERYKVERLPAEGRKPGLYVIRDMKTGELVEDSEGAALERFTMHDSAVAWIRGQIYLAESGCGRP